MPELPEVETVCRALAPALEGRTLGKVTVRRSDLRIPVPGDFIPRLEGEAVETVRRRAKYILISLAGGDVIIAHLGMSGRMLIYEDAPPAAGRHDHIDLVTTEGATVRFCDPRRFGLMTVTGQAGLADHSLLRDLGPDPLGNRFNADVLAAALKGRKGPIKAALLDQKIVAGIGNIYACESLFLAGISPRRKAGTVQGKRAERLVAAIRDVLAKAIEAGGTSIRDHVLPSGKLGYFKRQLSVYGRAGKPCPGCDCEVAESGGIRRIAQAGRSTFYCATRQR